MEIKYCCKSRLKCFSTVVFVCIGLTSLAQYGYQINPYIDYSGDVPPNYTNTIGSYTYEYNSLRSIHPQYTGEYMFSMQDLHWHSDGTGIPPNYLGHDFKQYPKYYTIETASFPFMPLCAFDLPDGCIDPLTNDRELFLPNGIFDSQNRLFDQCPNPPCNSPLFSHALWLTREKIPFNGSTNSGTHDLPETLISISYTNGDCVNAGPGNQDRRYIPHSILKHAIYIYCNPTDIYPIDSIVWVNDLTRGRLRDYPFHTANNNIGVSEINYDLLTLPKFMPFDVYNETHFYQNPGSLNYPYEIMTKDMYPFVNYFPWNNSLLDCNNNPILSGNIFYQNNNGNEEYSEIQPAEYTLIESFVRSTRGHHMAGYTLNNNNPATLDILHGIKHNYFIDQNIDLNIINPAEKIIYNPSEVSITANDLLFPAGYTFKTIRGMYPSVSEVMADDLAENGGPFADQRDVPVRTDLRSENSNDPNDPNDISHSVYAGRYYLMGDSKLTIENCVKL